LNDFLCILQLNNFKLRPGIEFISLYIYGKRERENERKREKSVAEKCRR